MSRGVDAVVARARLAPGRVPDGGLRDHGVRVHHVHADAVGAALLGQAAREVQLGRLGRAVGRVVLAGHHRVLGDDEHQAPAAALPLQHAEGLARDQEVAGGEDRVQPLPVRERRVLHRARRRDAGGQHRHVHAAEGQYRLAEGADHGGLVRHVHADAERMVADLLRGLARAVVVDVRDDHVRAEAGEALRGGPPDAAGAARDERHPAGHLLLRRHLRELVALERPVLDAERLRLVERHEAADRGDTLHDRDRTVVEPRRRDCRVLVLAGRDHADARDQDDPRIRVVHRVFRPAEALEVRRVERGVGGRRPGRRSSRSASALPPDHPLK